MTPPPLPDPLMRWCHLIGREGQLNRLHEAAGYPCDPSRGPWQDAQDLAKTLQDRGDLDGAMTMHKEAERLCREAGKTEGLAYSLGSQALILQHRGERECAAALHREAQRLYDALGNRKGVVAALQNRLKIAVEHADLDGAIGLYEEAECLYRERGNRREVAESLRRRATTLRERRDLEGASELISLTLFAYLSETRELRFGPFRRSGMYNLGERAGWTVYQADDGETPARKYMYEIKSNNLATLKRGTLDFSSGSATIETVVQEPMMLYVTITAERSTPVSAVHLGAAVAPAELKPSVQRPADFDDFWDGKLEQLSRISLNPVITASVTSGGVELSTVQVDCLGSHTHGYLAKPSRAGRFPALVIFQYAGAYALRPHTVTNRAGEGWLSFDVVSHDLPPQHAASASPNYESIGNGDRETSYFLKMYLRDARAVDFITSHPNWDGKTLVLMGTCMGGQQALATAALRPRVTAVIVNQPSGADSNGPLHGRKAGYPYWPTSNLQVMAAAQYFDIVNFAQRIKAPVLASIGFIDTTSPPAGIWTALNQIPGPKEVVSMVELDHTSRTPDKEGVFRSRASAVLNTLLHGGQIVPNP